MVLGRPGLAACRAADGSADSGPALDVLLQDLVTSAATQSAITLALGLAPVGVLVLGPAVTVELGQLTLRIAIGFE